MTFRLKAFALHLLASLAALSGILGTFYLGWYRWPGWYLADVTQVIIILVGVDLVIGPLLTLVIADMRKPRRLLARDVSMIAAAQLIALSYGSLSLWHGRPLYYAFSESVLQQVQAYDISDEERALATNDHVELRPHWYSLPRWIWAPLPQDGEVRSKIVTAAISGGDDVISMPRYYQRWEDGLAALRAQLKQVDDVGYFVSTEKKLLKDRMRAAGYDADQRNVMPLTGRGRPLLAVFDLSTLRIAAIFRAK